MRDIINLQALKRSTKRKHNAIYEKANRIIGEGFETQELSEDEVIAIASKYPQLEIRVLIGGDILVKSKKDTWMIRDEVRFLTLYHKTLGFKNGRLNDKYHVQDVFYDLEFTLASIISHDDYMLGIQKRTNDDILEMVQSNQ